MKSRLAVELEKVSTKNQRIATTYRTPNIPVSALTAGDDITYGVILQRPKMYEQGVLPLQCSSNDVLKERRKVTSISENSVDNNTTATRQQRPPRGRDPWMIHGCCGKFRIV